MGLLERASRRAQKLGLGSKVTAALPYLSLLAYAAGLVWLLVLPQDGQYRNTYVSENALLPHQATTFFRDSEWHVVRGYRNALRDIKEKPEVLRNDDLQAMFEALALKPATHDWEVPAGFAASQFGVQGGETVYAILHAPRGSHNEAVVVVAPWLNEEGRYNDGGVALLLSLARYFRRWSVWHKSIIFVIPSNSHAALRSWVEAYHTTLKNTAGSIEGVIVLDYPDEGEFFGHIDIAFDGLNGQQPNLDLLNAVVRIGDSEGVRSEILDMGSSYYQYGLRVKTVLRGIMRQIFAGLWPGPGSEMFSGWRIDAITIRARGEGYHDITTFGRVAESTVRSINNLLEHFHQSFFFYLLLGPRYFVSIGTYLPAALLTANSYPMMAVHTLIQEWKSGPNGVHNRDVMQAFALVSGITVLSFLYTLFLVWSPPNIYTHLFGFASVVAQVLIWEPSISTSAKRLAHALALIGFGLGLTVLAMLNFSQAMALALVALPVAWVRPHMRLNALLLVLSSPLVGVWATAAILNRPISQVLNQMVFANTELNIWLVYIFGTLWLPVWLVALVAGYQVPRGMLHPDITNPPKKRSQSKPQ